MWGSGAGFLEDWAEPTVVYKTPVDTNTSVIVTSLSEETCIKNIDPLINVSIIDRFNTVEFSSFFFLLVRTRTQGHYTHCHSFVHLVFIPTGCFRRFLLR